MGRLVSLLREIVTLSSPRGILIALCFLLLLVIVIPPEKSNYFPAKSLNKHTFPLVFEKIFDCPEEGFLENCCPSCGLTRASLYLTHGNLKKAWFHNPLVFLVFPVVIYLIVSNFIKLRKCKYSP